MHFNIPGKLFDIIHSDIPLDEKINVIRLEAAARKMTEEQIEIIIEALKLNMFASVKENTISTAITCNKCGRSETIFDTSNTINVDDLQDHPEISIRRLKAHFRRLGWITTLGYDVCPQCAQELSE